MTRYTVYLEVSEEVLDEGGYLAHVPALPGCVARGKSKEAAIARVREAIGAYHELMLRRGVSTASPVAFDIDVEETAELTLPSDYADLSPDEVADIERRGAATRAELRDLLSRLDPGAIDHRPSDDSWSLRNVLAHLAGADLWYASRLKEGGLAELIWRLAATRAIVLSELRAAASGAGGAAREHLGETWTPRKVGRRMLEHELEHMQQIREILADRDAARR